MVRSMAMSIREQVKHLRVQTNNQQKHEFSFFYFRKWDGRWYHWRGRRLQQQQHHLHHLQHLQS